MKRFTHVYQFRVALLGIRPPIWRRIQVPEVYTFWDLHARPRGGVGGGEPRRTDLNHG